MGYKFLLFTCHFSLFTVIMTPEQWQKVDEVFQGALDCAPHDRASFLDEVCEGDPELRLEADTLIKAHDRSGDFIEQPAVVEDARVLVDALDHNIGRDIGAYTILERLGAGGMGEVYLAQDRRLNRRVALKILPSLFASDDMRLRRFQREAQAASALNHPNILTIHEVGEHDGVWFIATEFIDGQTVRELIEDAALPVAEILDIAEQVASGLATAHAAGIVHRDIKPENIMKRSDGLVKILDFGIVKLLERPNDFAAGSTSGTQSHTEFGEVMGTTGYMSPEQARGLVVDERTDIWSLGVVLYEMVTRHAPFSGDTRMDTMVAILERAPEPLSSHVEQSPELQLVQRVIAKALSKEREDRYDAAGEMLVQLSSIRDQLKGATLFVPASESVKVSAHSSRVRRLLPLFVGVLVLTAAIATVWFYKGAVSRAPGNSTTATAPKVYAEMNEADQLAYISAQEQRISAMMGDRPAKLNDEALRSIKSYVDYYLGRRDNASGGMNADRLKEILDRGRAYAPLIAREFKARKVPVIIGLYLPMIESAYQPCSESSFGARGLFQFLPETARNYGVSRGEMCDVQKMAPAAAAYIADHMVDLGDDAESMTLVLLSYNRGATSVRNELRELRATDDYQRNFWTLFAHRDKLDESFRRESAGYVPNFFAAAIIGENPEAFGINTPPLSSFAK